MRRIVVLILLGVVLSSCGARKRTNQKKRVDVKINTPELPETPSVVISPTYNSTEDYIAFFRAIAIHEMKLYGIPASITLAQGILESGSGKGRLAREANNHFGIKCHDWKGPRIYHDDDRAQTQQCHTPSRLAPAKWWIAHNSSRSQGAVRSVKPVSPTRTVAGLRDREETRARRLPEAWAGSGAGCGS